VDLINLTRNCLEVDGLTTVCCRKRPEYLDKLNFSRRFCSSRLWKCTFESTVRRCSA